MAKNDIPTLSREDAAAAREAAVAARKKKEAKAAKERARREEIKNAAISLTKAGMPEDTELTLEQRRRAAAAVSEKAGLTGNALKTWILDGKNGKDVIAEAKASAPKEAGTRAPRQPRDPVARAFADAAAALAPELRSPFTPKEANLFKEKVDQVRLDDEDTIKAHRRDDPSIDVEFPIVALRQFAINGAKDPEIRGLLVKLGEGEKFLWGRKLGLFLLATDAEQQAAAKG